MAGTFTKLGQVLPTALPQPTFRHVAPRPLDLFGAGSPRIFGGLVTSEFHSAWYNFLKNHNQSARRSGAHYYITIEPDGGRAEGGQRGGCLVDRGNAL
jgi:hypothetical protein